jgi:hypothetical protein
VDTNLKAKQSNAKSLRRGITPIQIINGKTIENAKILFLTKS